MVKLIIWAFDKSDIMWLSAVFGKQETGNLHLSIFYNNFFTLSKIKNIDKETGCIVHIFAGYGNMVKTVRGNSTQIIRPWIRIDSSYFGAYLFNIMIQFTKMSR